MFMSKPPAFVELMDRLGRAENVLNMHGMTP